MPVWSQAQLSSSWGHPGLALQSSRDTFLGQAAHVWENSAMLCRLLLVLSPSVTSGTFTSCQNRKCSGSALLLRQWTSSMSDKVCPPFKERTEHVGVLLEQETAASRCWSKADERRVKMFGFVGEQELWNQQDPTAAESPQQNCQHLPVPSDTRSVDANPESLSDMDVLSKLFSFFS